MSKTMPITDERIAECTSLLREAGFSEQEIDEFQDSLWMDLVGEEE